MLHIFNLFSLIFISNSFKTISSEVNAKDSVLIQCLFCETMVVFTVNNKCYLTIYVVYNVKISLGDMLTVGPDVNSSHK